MKLLVILALLALAPRAQADNDSNISAASQDFVKQNLPRPWHANGPEFEKQKERIESEIDAGIRSGQERSALQGRIAAVDSQLNSGWLGVVGKTLGTTVRDEVARFTAQSATVEQKDSAQKKLQEVTQNEFEAYNKAISLTVSTYHLQPGTYQPPENDTVVDHIEVSPWLPHFSLNEVRDGKGGMRPETLEDASRFAKEHGLPEGAALFAGGRTLMRDGQIRIFAHAFSLDPQNPGAKPTPGMLAATIYHETSHWLDMCTQGHYMSPDEQLTSEKDAYQREASLASTFGLSASQVKQFDALAKLDAQRAQEVSNKSRGEVEYEHPDYLEGLTVGEKASWGDVDRIVPASTPGEVIADLDAVKTTGASDFDDWQKQAKSISQEIAQRTAQQEKADEVAQQKQEEEERKYQEERRSQEAELATEKEQAQQEANQKEEDRLEKEEQEKKDAAALETSEFSIIMRFTSNACYSPKTISEDDLPDVFKAIASLPESARTGPFAYDCAAQLAGALSQSDPEPDLKTIKNWAKKFLKDEEQYQREHSPSARGNNSGTSSSTGGSNNSGDSSHSGSSNLNVHDGPAQHQLKGQSPPPW